MFSQITITVLIRIICDRTRSPTNTYAYTSASDSDRLNSFEDLNFIIPFPDDSNT